LASLRATPVKWNVRRLVSTRHVAASSSASADFCLGPGAQTTKPPTVFGGFVILHAAVRPVMKKGPAPFRGTGPTVGAQPENNQLLIGRGATTWVIKSWSHSPSTTTCPAAPNSKASIRLWFT